MPIDIWISKTVMSTLTIYWYITTRNINCEIPIGPLWIIVTNAGKLFYSAALLSHHANVNDNASSQPSVCIYWRWYLTVLWSSSLLREINIYDIVLTNRNNRTATSYDVLSS